MTLSAIKALVAAVDPAVRHYWSAADGTDYTVWEETERLPLAADDRHIEQGWVFYVHRFTKTENDAIAAQLFQALDALPEIAVAETVDQEPDTGYIHHILRCEGV